MGKAPGISLSLRRAFDGGILAIVGVKSIATIGVENILCAMSIIITNTGQTKCIGNGHRSRRVHNDFTSFKFFCCQYHPFYTSNMADAASGSADRSVQVKLVLLGALSKSLIQYVWRLKSPYLR